MSDNTADKVEQFFTQYPKRNYAKSQILLLNGDRLDSVFYLTKGKVKTYDVTPRGDEIILNVFKSGAFFPMSLAISGEPSPYIYEAETDIELRQAPAADVVAFLQANADVMFDLLMRLYRGMDGVLGRMAHLMSSDAASRLAYELVLEARRFGRADSNGSCELDINAKDLGARAGLTRETISREMQKLKAQGHIDTRGRLIIVKDVAALAKQFGREI